MASRDAILRLPVALRQSVVTSRPSLASLAPSSPCSSSPRPYATETTHATPESSVNHDEVSHFNAMASDWWDPHGSSRLLHLMNPLRHQFIRRCLAPDGLDPDRKMRYLDIGCGGGIFAESAARMRNVESVTAIDPTPEVLAVAKKHRRTDPLLLEPGRLTYLQTSIEGLQTPSDKQYDVISLFEVIEHIQRPNPFLQSILKQLKPGGWLIGSTIARTPVSWFTTKFVAEDILRMVPRGTHDWNQYIQPQEMRDWARGQKELNTSDGVGWHVMGVVYVPGFGWKEVKGSEAWGNYFFAVKKREGAV
ncbi:Hexaprenyldihydroxybenzoate methyltransferase, mitochondrial [Recurvomyces mirabilis]|uniref:Ubiquinone biosynthesis O-methyltransferase, mitochondrial n=1 Tax=Recurvomyces mirabilis TaxID=574656 RepID=A0AAE0WQ55_9PEZI|nr:Hexaprenyldihydroxybenzoate methyltransferase, mitochondrial [Recurvomyces mirabilis]KAK5153702.1 Hexaprenyldihydroxybenzoate methyltransferase, mitochondrial [Recurvomyces mirabilis]